MQVGNPHLSKYKARQEEARINAAYARAVDPDYYNRKVGSGCTSAVEAIRQAVCHAAWPKISGGSSHGGAL